MKPDWINEEVIKEAEKIRPLIKKPEVGWWFVPMGENGSPLEPYPVLITKIWPTEYPFFETTGYEGTVFDGAVHGILIPPLEWVMEKIRSMSVYAGFWYSDEWRVDYSSGNLLRTCGDRILYLACIKALVVLMEEQ